MSEYAGQQFVGIDLHRRRSVIVRTTDAGEVLETVRIVNDVDRLNSVIDRAGVDPEVVLEATYGWYWAADALQAAGARVHLAHPLGVKAFAYRRVKNDVRDATDLADLLRMGRLPEAWIAPPATRELRELVRHRAKLVGLRSHCKAEVHAVLAKCGIQVLADRPVRGCRQRSAGPAATCRHRTRPGCPRCAGCWRTWTSRSTCSPVWSGAGSARTPAMSRSNRSPGSDRSWRRCSSPRSATSPGSGPHLSWRAGPG